MSKFGSKLDALISRNGGNKYRLSKEIGIDRVMLYRVINGERVPGKDFLDKILPALRLSPAEEKELRELCDIARIGEDVYERRLLVKNMVNKVNSLRLERMPATAHKSVVIEGIGDAVKVVSGSYNVNVLVRGVLDDLAYNSRSKRIWTNTPFEYSFLFDHLRQLYFEMNGAIGIEHAVAFARDAGSHKNPNVNLETLVSVLPFVFCEGIGYRPGYYYSDSIKSGAVFMPYYLFTTTRLLMFSADYKTAMLINDPDAVAACRVEFDALRVTPMFHYVDDIEKMLGAYLDIWTHTKKPEVIGIEAQPCLAWYSFEGMIETYVKKELPGRDSIMKALSRHLEYGKTVANTRSFFTVEGLEDFCDSGYMMYISPQIAAPFNMADRRFLIKSLRDDVAANRSNSRVIDPSEISVSINTTIQVYINSTLLFSIANGSGMRMCLIDEPSIFEAFSDFLKNLDSMGCLYSKQETLEILDKYIDILENNRGVEKEQ